MGKHSLALFLAIALPAFSAWGETRDPYRELLDWEAFTGGGRDRCVQVSSADPTGGNEDFSHFVTESPGGVKVLADLRGPGCVTRIWLTASPESLEPARILFFFDGASSPTVDFPVLEFFRRQDPPFVHPLIGDETQSSGGYYCYVPFPFRESCRIEVAGLGKGRFYYSLNATRYPPGDTVETFTWPLSPARADLAGEIVQQWKEAGKDLTPVGPGIRRLRNRLTVPPGGTGTAFEIAEDGLISGLKVRAEEFSPEILQKCFLRILWDGVDSPAVNAPFAEFFSAPPGGEDFRSLAFRRQGNELACFLPMPYEKTAVIEVHNTGRSATAELEVEIDVGPHLAGVKRPGRLYAVYNEQELTDSSGNYVLMDIAGEGHYAGTVLSVRGGSKDFYPYLEGDEMFYVDDEEQPSIQGTGTEDYFNGGWYYNAGTFADPLHGLVRKGSELGDTTQYRIHMLDHVPFRKRLRATIEHGASNTVRAHYRSVAFAYCSDARVNPAGKETGAASKAAPPAKPGANLLINPGAEEGMTGWTGGGEPAYAPQIDPETHTPNPPNHSGNHRFGLSVGWSTADCYQYQTIPVEPGQTYEASLWLTRRNGTDEVLEMLWIDGEWPGKEQVLYRSEGPEITEWTELSGATFVPSKDRVTIVIRYRHHVASDICSIHVDDISVRQVVGSAPPTTGLAPAGE